MPPEAAEAADSGSMSIEQGIAAMRALPPEPVAAPPEEAPAEQPEEPEAEAPEGDEPGDDTPSEAEPAAEDLDGAETPAEEDPADPVEPEAKAPAIDAPQFWDADAKAKFSALPPEAQHLVVEQDKVLRTAAAKVIEEAAQARKTAEGQASKVTQLADELNAFLPDALKAFADKWDGIDWQAWAAAEPAKALEAQFAMQAEQKLVEQAKASATEANRIEHERFVVAEADSLAKMAVEHAPELLDPKVGQVRRQEIGQYLVSGGIAPERLSNITAAETIIAYKAMMYDRSVATASAAAARPKPVVPPKPAAATPQRPAIRPSAPATAATPRQSTLQAAERRLDRSGSIEDGIAALRARRSLKAR